MCVKMEKVLFYLAVTALSLTAKSHQACFPGSCLEKTKDHKPTKHLNSLTEGRNLQYEIRFIVIEPNNLVDYRIRCY